MVVSSDSNRHRCPLQEEWSFPVNHRIFSFLEPPALGRAGRVCRKWNEVIQYNGGEYVSLWEKQYRRLYNIPKSVTAGELAQRLPVGSSYKEAVRLYFCTIFDAEFYERYLGKVPPAPPIPRGMLSWQVLNREDPCDPTTTIGKAYAFMYVPPYIEIDMVPGDRLDGPDDPNHCKAPRFLRERPVKQFWERKVPKFFRQETRPLQTLSGNAAERCIGLSKEWFKEQGLLVLKVPLTINNLRKIFQHPKTGNPSTYRYIWGKVVQQHGDTPIPPGWICLRKDVIGRNLSFSDQRNLAQKCGVEISTLAQRVLFDFVVHVGSGTANVYPDGEAPLTYARTSTLVNNWFMACGAGGPSGLSVRDGSFDYVVVGVGVALPSEVQAIGP